jgi:hypothetical protein
MIYNGKGTNLDEQHTDLQVSLKVVMTLPKTFLNNAYEEHGLTADNFYTYPQQILQSR